MNKRIYELATQAAMSEGFGPEVWQTTFTDKFAQLIVVECMSIVSKSGNSKAEVLMDLEDFIWGK